MTALVFTAVAVLLVAGPLVAALTHHRQENTMPRHTSRSIGIDPSPDFEPPAMALDQLDDIGDRGTCTARGSHEHRWWRIEERDDGTVKLSIVVPVGPSGVVVLSEGSVEEILTAAGFTRSES